MKEGLKEFFCGLLAGGRPGDRLCHALAGGQFPLPCFLCEAPYIPAGPRPWHNGSLLDHMARCMNAVAGNPLAVWMALTHDAGKLTTPKVLWPHHYGHELRGVLLAAVWAKSLDLSQEYLTCGCLAARLHMKAGRYALLRPGTRYGLLLEVENGTCADSFWKVVDADTRSAVSLRAREDWRRIRDFSGAGLSGERLRQQQIRLLAKLTEAAT